MKKWNFKFREMLDIHKESEEEPLTEEYEVNKERLKAKHARLGTDNTRKFEADRKTTEELFKFKKGAHERAVNQLVMELSKLEVRKIHFIKSEHQNPSFSKNSILFILV